MLGFSYLCTVQSLKDEVMKKVLLLILAVMVSQVAVSQKVVRNRVVASVAMGNNKLVEIEGRYSIRMRAANLPDELMYIDLGDSANAVRLLTFLSELRVKDDEVVVLENPSGNTIESGPFGSFTVFDDLKVIYGHTHHTYCEKMLKALTGKSEKKQSKWKRRAK